MSVNSVVLTGNLTRDGELRMTAGGTYVLDFTVAVNDRRRNQSGEWEDYANFIDCTMFGTRADKLSQYMSKGQKVALVGKLHWSSWEKDGKRRSKTDVIVDDVELLGGRRKEPAASQDVYDEDIPF